MMNARKGAPALVERHLSSIDALDLPNVGKSVAAATLELIDRVFFVHPRVESHAPWPTFESRSAGPNASPVSQAAAQPTTSVRNLEPNRADRI
jgi:hypothetical protein